MSVAIPSLRAAIAVPRWVKNELWRRARVVPSLDLRFADNKSLVDAVTGASLITFNRASSGTFVDSARVLQTAATDVPRFDHNPTTGESLGLLVEEQRTNLLLNSEDFSTTWANAGITVQTNATIAPNGTITAGKLVENTASTSHFIIQIVTISSPYTLTCSFYAKAGERSRVGIWLRGASSINRTQVVFDLSTGLTSELLNTGLFSGGVASMAAAGNGWYRCSVSATCAAGEAQLRAALYLMDGTVTISDASYTGDGTSGIYLWGAQLEAGAFPTSYIPTTTAAVTRSADVASITGSAFSSWYRQDAQTWYGEYAAIYTASATIPANTPHLMQVYTAASANNNYAIRGAEPSTIQVAIARNPTSGTQFLGVALGFALAWQSRRLAYAINSTELQLAGMGVLGGLVTNNFAALMATHDILSIGSGTGGAEPQQVNGHIRRLTYWPTRLGNEVLQGITQ